MKKVFKRLIVTTFKCHIPLDAVAVAQLGQEANVWFHCFFRSVFSCSLQYGCV